MDPLSELCAVLDKSESSLSFAGWLLYDLTHKNGLRHLTVQIIPVQFNPTRDEPVILIHRRSADRTVGANQWDFCGGHARFDSKHIPADWNSLEFLRRLSDDTALEEVNEELSCAPPTHFESTHLHLFKTIGAFEVDLPASKGRRNVESSSAYVVCIPSGRAVKVTETVRGEHRSMSPESLPLTELLARFRAEPESFADGAARILAVVSQDPAQEHALQSLIASVCLGPSP